jgi:hypothetical protein
VTTPFTGWLLDEDERAALLVRLPARHGEAIAHHVTLSVRDETTPTPTATTGEIVGQADDGGVQAMVVRHRRNDRASGRRDLSHHLVARRRPQPARKQRRDRPEMDGV